jgi:hypothetical protein
MNAKARSLLAVAVMAAGAYGLGLLLGQGVKHLVGLGRSDDRASLTVEAPRPGSESALGAANPAEDGAPEPLAPAEALRVFGTKLREGRLERYAGYGWSGYTQLMPLVGAFSTNEFPQAWKLVDAQTAELRAPLRQALAFFWSRTDPPAALAAGLTLPAARDRDELVQAILANWGRRDPQAALAAGQWLQSLPADDARAEAAEAYISAAAARRPDLAAQWIGSIPDETKRNQQVEIIARAWLRTDPAAAQAWLQQTSLPDERKQRLLAK